MIIYLTIIPFENTANIETSLLTLWWSYYLGIQQGMCEKGNLELELECENRKADFLLKTQE